MKRLLHILTKENDSLSAEVISQQRVQADAQVEVVDLTKPEPNYADLLEKIFAADSISVW